MGGLSVLSCEACGYRSDGLTLGPAPYPDKFDPVLCHCPMCKELVVGNRLDRRKRCPTCSGPVRSLARVRHVKCPRCTQVLREEMVGLWD